MALRAERSGASHLEKNLENGFAFLEFFECLSIKATPCLEKGRAFYCMAVGAGIVRLPELRGGRRLPRVVGDADPYSLYGNTA